MEGGCLDWHVTGLYMQGEEVEEVMEEVVRGREVSL